MRKMVETRGAKRKKIDVNVEISTKELEKNAKKKKRTMNQTKETMKTTEESVMVTDDVLPMNYLVEAAVAVELERSGPTSEEEEDGEEDGDDDENEDAANDEEKEGEDQVGRRPPVPLRVEERPVHGVPVPGIVDDHHAGHGEATEDVQRTQAHGDILGPALSRECHQRRAGPPEAQPGVLPRSGPTRAPRGSYPRRSRGPYRRDSGGPTREGPLSWWGCLSSTCTGARSATCGSSTGS